MACAGEIRALQVLRVRDLCSTWSLGTRSVCISLKAQGTCVRHIEGGPGRAAVCDHAVMLGFSWSSGLNLDCTHREPGELLDPNPEILIELGFGY